MSLDATIDALRTVVDTIDGLIVYDDPPESINQHPAAIVYSEGGDMEFGSATLGRNYHTLRVDILHSAQRLPQAVDAAKAWPDLMYTAIQAAQAASTFDVVDTNGRSRFTYRTGPLPYNNVMHFGVRFTIRLKEVMT